MLTTCLLGLALSACDKPAETAPGATAPASVTAHKAAAVPDARPNPEQVERGRQIYEKHCMECHGAEGKGQPGDWRVKGANGMYPPPPLDDTAHAWHHPTAVLKQRIREGSPPGVGDMPSWDGKLTEAEIDDVVVYVKSLWSPEVFRHWVEIEMRSMQN
ncbi:MAG: c-type cytochrome [Pseudomonadota bacterium]